MKEKRQHESCLQYDSFVILAWMSEQFILSCFPSVLHDSLFGKTYNYIVLEIAVNILFGMALVHCNLREKVNG